MPVWHASISTTAADGRRKKSAGAAEREAVALLADVGGDREWWIWNPRAGVGHLRVALTLGEYASIPHGVAEFDAGPSGPERPRTRGRR